MLKIEIPGWKTLNIEHLLLDVNGTLSRDGTLLPVVPERIIVLCRDVHILLVSADTNGTLDRVASLLGLEANRVGPGGEAEQKRRLVESLGADSVVAVGNGVNDVEMLRAASIGIAVLGFEGLARDALDASDVLVASIDEALDLLLHPRRLMATLRR